MIFNHDVEGVEVERRLRGEPVLEAVSMNPWESRVVLNPAADIIAMGDGLLKLLSKWDLDADSRKRLVTVGAACVMLYRARGAPQRGFTPDSSLGLAVFTPALQLIKRWPLPVLEPKGRYLNQGFENPRMTRVGDRWHIYYTGYLRDPGPGREARRDIRVCHASTEDFIHWDVDGPVKGDLGDVPSKNAALLPQRVGREWILLHRPLSEEDPTAIFYATSDDPAGPWTTRGLVMDAIQSEEYAKVWVGVAGPPISIGDDRFIMIYHRGTRDHDNNRQYDLATALLDFKKRTILRARIEPIMTPSTNLERCGDPEVGCPNVVYSCANYMWSGEMVVPYAGADSRIFVASIPLDDLIGSLEVVAREGQRSAQRSTTSRRMARSSPAVTRAR